MTLQEKRSPTLHGGHQYDQCQGEQTHPGAVAEGRLHLQGRQEAAAAQQAWCFKVLWMSGAVPTGQPGGTLYIQVGHHRNRKWLL